MVAHGDDIVQEGDRALGQQRAGDPRSIDGHKDSARTPRFHAKLDPKEGRYHIFWTRMVVCVLPNPIQIAHFGPSLFDPFSLGLSDFDFVAWPRQVFVSLTGSPGARVESHTASSSSSSSSSSSTDSEENDKSEIFQKMKNNAI